jgi:hypothetical protein
VGTNLENGGGLGRFSIPPFDSEIVLIIITDIVEYKSVMVDILLEKTPALYYSLSPRSWFGNRDSKDGLSLIEESASQQRR